MCPIIPIGYGPRTCECFLNVNICPVGREITSKIVFSGPVNMAEITKIDKLSGENYQSWKYNVKLGRKRCTACRNCNELPLKMLFSYVRIKRIP